MQNCFEWRATRGIRLGRRSCTDVVDVAVNGAAHTKVCIVEADVSGVVACHVHLEKDCARKDVVNCEEHVGEFGSTSGSRKADFLCQTLEVFLLLRELPSL
jgi:hypothetical protein